MCLQTWGSGERSGLQCAGEQEPGVSISGSAGAHSGSETWKRKKGSVSSSVSTGANTKEEWISFTQLKSQVNKQLICLSRITDDFFNSSRKRKQNHLPGCWAAGKTTFVHPWAPPISLLCNSCFNQVRPLPLSLRNQHILVFDEWIDISSHIDVFNMLPNPVEVWRQRSKS